MHPPNLQLQLPSKENLTLEELSQAWEFLADLYHRADGQLVPPRQLQRLQLEDWILLSDLLARELAMRERHGVH